MGIEDRDWYRDAQREKAQREQLEATRHKFERYSATHLRGSSQAASARTGLLPMLLFWLVVMAVLYGLMQHFLAPKRPQVLASGELRIARSADGHFRTVGTVNGRETTFLVDTGASLVSVSDAFAAKAALQGGVPTSFQTANGVRPGRMVDGVTVAVGPLQVHNLRVGVGISASPDDEALLGQSFLSKFQVTLDAQQMVLRRL